MKTLSQSTGVADLGEKRTQRLGIHRAGGMKGHIPSHSKEKTVIVKNRIEL